MYRIGTPLVSCHKTRQKFVIFLHFSVIKPFIGKKGLFFFLLFFLSIFFFFFRFKWRKWLTWRGFFFAFALNSNNDYFLSLWTLTPLPRKTTPPLFSFVIFLICFFLYFRATKTKSKVAGVSVEIDYHFRLGRLR